MAKRSEIENTKQTLKGLCVMARKLGYADPMYRMQIDRDACVGDLMDFFEDNPGAIAAVVEFVLENNTDREGEPLEDDDGEDTDEEEGDEEPA